MMKGWIEKPLNELFDFYGGLSASRAQLSDKGYPYLHYGDIHGSVRTFVDVCFDKSIPRLDVDLNKVSNVSFLNDGDIVFVDASEDEEGTSRHIVVRNIKNVPFISGLHTIIAKAKTDELDNGFREFCFQTEAVKSQFRFYAVGTKVMGVNKTTIGKILLYYPVSKTEQRRIAEVLSDTDAFISALEKLISKKRAIKQGVMQELLTGKRRLPGFSGEWKEQRVGDLGNTYSGLTGKRKENFGKGNARYITFLNVLLNTIIDTAILESVDVGENEIQNAVQCGDLFFNTSSETPEEVGMCAVLLNELKNTYLNSFCFGFRLIDTEVDGLFLSYYFNSHCGRKIMTLLAQGATRYNLSKTYFDDTTIKLPILAEQTAIASILSDMDAEIDALSNKLNKLHNIKQGMMSELLTGRIRLTDAETSEAIVQQAKVTLLPTTESKPITTPSHKGHNEQFDDAVAFADIVDKFFHPPYKLGRVKMYKLLYLFRRHQEVKISGFTKMSAGPYKADARYRGGEKIAIKNGYIVETKGKEGFIVSKGKNISAALKYSEEWQWQDAVKWLVSNFQYKSRNDLETLATVDMAVCELYEAGTAVDLQSVKEIINSNQEWKPKLSKSHFSDDNIIHAIKWSNDLFGQGSKPE